MLEMLREADYVLNECGRPVPPPGWKFVDLPRAIPFQSTIAAAEGAPNSTPSAFRLSNNYRTLFIVKGIVCPDASVAFQIRWPSGRFFFQTPPSVLVNPAFPNGNGAAMFTLDKPEPLPTGARFSIEQSSSGTLNLQFWGVVRYLLKDTGGTMGEVTDRTCIIGYPAEARSQSRDPFKVSMVPDPVKVLEALPRYVCGPNQNIMDPAFLMGLGSQDGLRPKLRPGESVEPFTFFSDAFAVPSNTRRYNLAVLVPGQDDVIVRRVRLLTVDEEQLGGTVVFSLRLPNGYGVTGGDLVPADLLDWWPVFTTFRIRAGDRMIIDLGDIDSGGGTLTTTFEFDCWKVKKR